MYYITTCYGTIVAYITDGEAINKGLPLPYELPSNRGVAADEKHVYVCNYNASLIIIF